MPPEQAVALSRGSLLLGQLAGHVDEYQPPDTRDHQPDYPPPPPRPPSSGLPPKCLRPPHHFPPPPRSPACPAAAARLLPGRRAPPVCEPARDPPRSALPSPPAIGDFAVGLWFSRYLRAWGADDGGCHRGIVTLGTGQGEASPGRGAQVGAPGPGTGSLGDEEGDGQQQAQLLVEAGRCPDTATGGGERVGISADAPPERGGLPERE